jgi:peptide/nickel transport system ATP-binding protein
MTLLSVSDLKTTYRAGDAAIHAVDGVSFEISRGQTIGLVGESGCGKSTLGKSIMRLVEPSSGQVLFDGTDITRLSPSSLRRQRRRLQMVFQDPFSSLNPRQTVGEILIAPLHVHGVGKRSERPQAVANILARVGLPAHAANRYPHEFSGGQRQRIGIARALILQPELVICDEPVSALDLSVQAQILNLLSEIKHSFDLSLLFISHDLSVVRYLADHVMVMYLGRIVEVGSHQQIWRNPLHPYTRALIDAIPDPARRRLVTSLRNDTADARGAGNGCRFRFRCPIASEICAQREPSLQRRADGHDVACHHAEVKPA